MVNKKEQEDTDERAFSSASPDCKRKVLGLAHINKKKLTSFAHTEESCSQTETARLPHSAGLFFENIGR
jgi:hypothetical protein